MADNSINTSTVFLCLSSAVSCTVSYIFYRLYRSRSETARQVRHILVWHPDVELEKSLSQQDKNNFGYVGVEGVVKELGRILPSHYGKEEGVIVRSRIVEHKSRLENGLWVDMKKVIRDSLEMVPFAIVKENKGDSKYKVEVTKPGEALQLQEELETTYDRFENSKISLDRFFGEFTKGIEITEQMLMTGTNILGVGKVFLEQGQMKLGPPDSERSYILTTMRLSELVKYYESQSTSYKVVAVIAACVGGSLLVYAIYRHVSFSIEQQRRRLEFEEIRRTLAEHRRHLQSVRNSDVSEQAHHSSSSENINAAEEQAEVETNLRPEDTCVVCLINARQVISLPCGHYVICTYCAELLPSPKRCPVCRADVEKFMPVYRS